MTTGYVAGEHGRNGQQLRGHGLQAGRQEVQALGLFPVEEAQVFSVESDRDSLLTYCAGNSTAPQVGEGWATEGGQQQLWLCADWDLAECSRFKFSVRKGKDGQNGSSQDPLRNLSDCCLQSYGSCKSSGAQQTEPDP
ncbi:hypothetical protein AOLI_G00283890 [Acnodon oligacanthus]